MKGLMIDEWFAHVKRIERGMIAKRVYAGEFAGSRSAGRPRKSWLDTVKRFGCEASKKNGP